MVSDDLATFWAMIANRIRLVINFSSASERFLPENCYVQQNCTSSDHHADFIQLHPDLRMQQVKPSFVHVKCLFNCYPCLCMGIVKLCLLVPGFKLVVIKQGLQGQPLQSHSLYFNNCRFKDHASPQLAMLFQVRYGNCEQKSAKLSSINNCNNET